MLTYSYRIFSKQSGTGSNSHGKHGLKFRNQLELVEQRDKGSDQNRIFS